jgi:hypothetical protein
VSPETRRELGRRIAAARRRLVDADYLVEVEGGRWRSVLAGGPADRLERAAVRAVRGNDARAAHQAVAALERAALFARRRVEGRR